MKRTKEKKPSRMIMDEEDIIKELELEIGKLKERIWELENEEHFCSKCGNVIRPSRYDDYPD